MNKDNHTGPSEQPAPYLKWLNPLKAFALLAILLNHLVEEFGKGPWFTNPSNHWPDFSTRMGNIVPEGFPHPVALLQFLGWLGDSAPGVFILVSGIGLTWSALHGTEGQLRVGEFYLRRLGRIYPLYITMHLIFLAGAVFVPAHLIKKVSSFSFTLDSPYTLLSMLGLRCTDSLFFGFISPAWWFVWLILQLYLAFPLLYILLQRVGIKQFLILTCSFTFAVRLFGICYPQFLPYSLFNWMTGIFFGTRLAEFSAGMAFAIFLKKQSQLQLPAGKIFFISAPLYLVGLVSSFTWPGTVISNFFVTLGMSGLFYSLWQGGLGKTSVSRIIVWIGVYSYGIYLFHQPPLKMTAILHLSQPYHMVAAIAVLAFSFIAAWMIKKSMALITHYWQKMLQVQSIQVLSFIGILGGMFVMLAMDQVSGWQHRLLAIFAGMLLIFLFFLEYSLLKNNKLSISWLRWAVICALFLKLFFFPSLPGTLVSLVLGSTIVIFSQFFCRNGMSSNFARWSGVLVVVLSVIAGELLLTIFAPREVGKWGELPALQAHPTRLYGLKPNATTHLKYKNYDYVVRTNSLGLTSPEIDIQKPTPDTLRILVVGDAFSMPEGLEYKDSYPALLEQKIAQQEPLREIQVVNGGVTGYGPVEEYHQLQELGPLLQPDIVIYQFFINEFGEVNATPEGRLKGIGLVPSGNLEQFDFIERSQLIRHAGELAYGLVDFVIRNYADRSLFINNVSVNTFRFLEKMTGQWRYRSAHLQFYRTGENERYNKERLDKLRYHLAAMHQVCREIRAKFVIYFVPGAVAVSNRDDMKYFPLDQDVTDRTVYNLDRPFENLKKITGSLGIDVVDLTPHLKDHSKQPVYFPTSFHWNKEGHGVAANVIAQDLSTRGYIDDKQ